MHTSKTPDMCSFGTDAEFDGDADTLERCPRLYARSGHGTTGSVARGCALFIGEQWSRYTRCLRARQLLAVLLEQFQQPLSASPRQLPRGQPSSWDPGAGLDKRDRIRVLGDRLGDHTHSVSVVVGSLLALHLLPLSYIRSLPQRMVHEYIRNRSIGQQVRALTQEKRGESMSRVLDLAPSPCWHEG